MARLKTFVHVDGVWFGPGSDVPSDVAARITNPDAWSEPPAAKAAATEEAPKPAAPRRRTGKTTTPGD